MSIVLIYENLKYHLDIGRIQKTNKQTKKNQQNKWVSLVFPGGSDGKESACNAGDPIQFLCLEDSQEKGMARDSSILAWGIPWTKESGELQSMGSQRVGRD